MLDHASERARLLTYQVAQQTPDEAQSSERSDELAA